MTMTARVFACALLLVLGSCVSTVANEKEFQKVHRDALRRGTAALVRRGSEASVPETKEDGPTPETGEATTEEGAKGGESEAEKQEKIAETDLHGAEEQLDTLKKEGGSESDIAHVEKEVEHLEDEVEQDENKADPEAATEHEEEKDTEKENEELLKTFTDSAKGHHGHQNPAVLVTLEVKHFPNTADDEKRKAFKDKVVEAFNEVGTTTGEWTVTEEEVSITVSTADSPALVLVRIHEANDEKAKETHTALGDGSALVDAVNKVLQAGEAGDEFTESDVTKSSMMVQEGSAGEESADYEQEEGSEDGAAGPAGPVGPAGPAGPKGATPDASDDHVKDVAHTWTAELAVAFHFICLWLVFKSLSKKLSDGRKKLREDLAGGKPADKADGAGQGDAAAAAGVDASAKGGKDGKAAADGKPAGGGAEATLAAAGKAADDVARGVNAAATGAYQGANKAAADASAAVGLSKRPAGQ